MLTRGYSLIQTGLVVKISATKVRHINDPLAGDVENKSKTTGKVNICRHRRTLQITQICKMTEKARKVGIRP